MNMVYIYALIGVLSGAAAYLSGQAGGGVFWLYVAGAVLFFIAAAGQYAKETQRKK